MEESSKNLGSNIVSLSQFNSGISCSPATLMVESPVREPATLPPFSSAPHADIDWDPRAMLSNISFIEERIHHIKGLIHTIIGSEGHSLLDPGARAAQRQLAISDLRCIVVQLISTACTLLPSMKGSAFLGNPQLGQLLNSSSLTDRESGGALPPQYLVDISSMQQQIANTENETDLMDGFDNNCMDGADQFAADDHDGKELGDDAAEHLLPGSYQVLELAEEEILAPHTHFCSICGKGFKRDANLRMHMRGHGDQYKSPAALAKPPRDQSSGPVLLKRYSCPFVGCKRNKEHKNFQPLKTILCVKNHYKRSHCEKSYTCSRCNTKKFSVLADLKTHEKHCGRDRWMCSCGTTFSRKDKLFGHVALFQGHTPALPPEEIIQVGPAELEVGRGSSSNMEMAALGDATVNNNFVWSLAGNGSLIDFKSLGGGRREDCFSPLSFDKLSFGGGIDDFSRPPFDHLEGAFSFLTPSSSDN